MTETESIEQFQREFAALTGHGPYPWQTRLYLAFTCGEHRDFPDALDIPTGLGKTTVMDIWLLAHLLGTPRQRPPMRLVYVVNRRTIVDQATTIAEKLAKQLGPGGSSRPLWAARFDGDQSTLAVSTLRGAKADSGDWLLAPHRPAIIVGTVDMVGSRLLFNGYRTGRWQRARHAGLLGHDSLLVHDEAHLSKPFQKMLEWTKSVNHGPRAMRVMPMSATAGASGNVLRIDAEDRERAKAKLLAGKRVQLHVQDDKIDPARVAQLASAHEPENARVIVFVRSPDTAAKVVAALKKNQKIDGERIELLTGTIRGHERDELVKQPVLRHLLDGWETDQPRTEYLVSTSAGEVGADFDGDHLVCDLSTIDAMIQRFGRVNRRGRDGHVATIDVLLDKPATKKAGQKLSDIETSRLACAAFLESLKAEQGDAIDASPVAITGNPDDDRAGWRQRDGYAAACEPEVPTVNPHPAVLDAWSLTSVQDDWPLAHDVEPYLHGLKDDAPQTFVAWRAELDHLGLPDQDTDKIDPAPARDILNQYRLLPRELLQDKPSRVAELLVAARARFPDKPVVVIAGRKTEVLRLRELYGDPKRIEEAVANRTIILPASVGGLGDKGAIEPISEKPTDPVKPATDVADQTTIPQEQRARIVATLHGDERDEWIARRLANVERKTPDKQAEPTQPFATESALRNAWTRHLNMRLIDRVVLAEGEDGVGRVLLLYAARASPTIRATTVLTIDKHNRQVLEATKARVGDKGLQLNAIEQEAMSFAAACHDLGKANPTWQRAVGNKPGDPPVAKSLGKGMNNQILNGYRHECGSLVDAVKTIDRELPDEATRDLALHLIAVHHGRGRPHFTAEATGTGVEPPPAELQPAAIAVRFDRLQRTYGYWRLAWLESVLMSADVEASQAHEAAAAEDEDGEDNS